MEITEDTLTRAAVAPRVTLASLEDAIIAEHYFTAYEGRLGAVFEGNYESKGKKAGSDQDLSALKLLTFCVLVLKNGFTVHGVSACASPANFNREIGESIARKNAVEQMWPLMGYELKTKLHNQDLITESPVLGTAVSHLLSHSMGNPTVLSAEDAGLIVSELIPQNAQSNEDIANICYEAYRSWQELNDDPELWAPWGEGDPENMRDALDWVIWFRANPEPGPDVAMTFKTKLYQSIVKASTKPALTPTHNHLRLVG